MNPAASSVTTLFAARAAAHPARLAVSDERVAWTYGELRDRVARLASLLMDAGVRRGDRLAVVSENRAEYLETILAAGWIGAVVACQNWRLADPELRHCLDLVTPTLVFASPSYAARLESIGTSPSHVYGAQYEAALAAATPADPPAAGDPEDPLLILYTSGTTGLPKGAVISHRAQIARNLVVRAEYGLDPADAYVAWSPMYHMGGTEYSLGTLMSGGTVVVLGGFDPEELVEVVRRQKVGWLLLMPGMVGRFADALEQAGPPQSVKVCGVMADLVPLQDIARVTRLLDAPYANTFGATETGNPPASAGLLAVGQVPETLAKVASIFCEIRLVDAAGRDVPDGEPGELWLRGPTLFSGYWDASEATAEAFAGGWFHMGDVFVRRPDGRLEFVDRVKYLIKSGGENVYPAEIERVLLAEPLVSDAAVVRRPDATWGEVPVAFVSRRSDALDEATLFAACRRQLAGFKQPKEIRFIAFEDFPRSASGKIQRHELEKQLNGASP